MNQGSQKPRRFVEIDASLLRSEIAIRAWTSDRFASEIARHPNTADRILGAQGVVQVDADTAHNVALALERTPPLRVLVALQPRPKGRAASVNGAATPRLPVNIGAPGVWQRILDENPALKADYEMMLRVWEQPGAADAYLRYRSTFNSRGLTAVEPGFADLRDFLKAYEIEHAPKLEAMTSP